MIAGFYAVDAAWAPKPLQTDSVSRGLFLSLCVGEYPSFNPGPAFLFHETPIFEP
jgi:hypothetical protein